MGDAIDNDDDNDGMGDAIDNDDDNDGVADDIDEEDNDDDEEDHDEENDDDIDNDDDNDGIPDDVDNDDDNDGIPDDIDDDEDVIEKMTVSLDEMEAVFDGLEHNTKYKVKVVSVSCDKESEPYVGQFRTKEITQPLPVNIHSDYNSEDDYSYTLKFSTAGTHGGGSIMSITVKFTPIKNGTAGKARVEHYEEIEDEMEVILENLDDNTEYKVEIVSENEVMESEIRHFSFKTQLDTTSGAALDAASASMVLIIICVFAGVLLLIDVVCCCTRKWGLCHHIYTNCCGGGGQNYSVEDGNKQDYSDDE